MSETNWIELRPGIPWTTATELNRIARQQGLCLAMAQASVYDEICQVLDLPEQIEQTLVKTYEAGQGINTSDQRRSGVHISYGNATVGGSQLNHACTCT